ncbi:MAG: ABC transporter permease [Pseudomonadota bacterium]
MQSELLTFELALKGGLGLSLLTVPITLARVVGLPHGNVGLWPRLLGAALIGIAAAIWVENDIKTVRGIGLGGLIAINAVGFVSLLVITLLLNPGTRRGRIALWSATLVLFGLCVLEISQI